MMSETSSVKHLATCFLSLPHEFDTVREGLSRVVSEFGGDVLFVTQSQGDKLRNEIVRDLSRSAILIADLSSSPSERKVDQKGPRPAVMWEIGQAEAMEMGVIVICQMRDKGYVPAVLQDYHVIYYDLNKTGPMCEEVEGALGKLIAREHAAGPAIFRARCYADRRSSDLEVRYLEARTSIKILELNLQTVEKQIGVIVRALETNTDLSVQILTLNPFSKFTDDRADQLAELHLPYRRQLYHSIASCHAGLGGIPSERWGLRIYDTFPTQIMFQVDEAMIHSIISLGKRSRDMLHFEVQASHPNSHETFAEHFAQLWSQSVDYEKWHKQNERKLSRLLGPSKTAT